MKLQHMLLAGVTGALLVFSGCGEDSKDSSTSTTSTSTATFSLTGTVDTSSLSSSDQTLVRSRARDFRATDDEVVKLYTLDKDGELVATSITCTVSGGDYSCPSVPGNTEYVVRYVKDLGNGKVLELKTNASVKNTTPDPVKVDPVTTMVAEAIVKAVKEAIIGVTSDEALIKSIIQSVQKAVTDTMTTLVKAGTIKIPSMVVEEDFTDIATSGTVTTNENLSSATGTVLTNSSVTTTLAATKTEIQGENYTKLTPKEQLLSVFEAIGWKEMPAWVLEMFSDNFDITDKNLTFAGLETMMKNGYTDINASELANNSDEYMWSIENLVRIGKLTGDVNASFVALSAQVKTALDAKDIVTEFKNELGKYYTIKAKAVADRNESEMDYITHFPAAITSVFPSTYTVASTTKVTNMAQLFVFMGYMDKVIQDITAEKLATDKYFGDVRLLKDNLGEALLGSMFTESDMSKYNYITFDRIELRMQNVWVDGASSPTEGVALEYASLSKLGWDMGMDEVNASLVGSATITYPTASGTATKDLNISTDWGLGAYLSPWPRNCYNNCTADVTRLMTDAVSGNFTVSITYDGKEYNKTKTYTVLKGLAKRNPKMISPKAYPQWSSDPDFNQTAFNNEMAAFQAEGISNFVPNSDNNTTLSGAVFTWKAPDLTGITLPSNVQLAYSVNISLTKMDQDGDGNITDTEMNNCNQNWEKCNEDIYNTWDEGRPITTTSITLPVKLEKTEGTQQYSINVNAMYIDKVTGNEVAWGGHTYAQFTVGEGTALTGSENIRFEGNFTLYDATYSTFPSNAKIAIISEMHQYNESTDKWEHNATVIATGTIDQNKTFAVDLNASTLRENTGNNKNINLILFGDADSDGVWDQWDGSSTTNYGENAYWPENKWLWVENWGDLRINVNSPDSSESYKVVKDNNLTITGFGITIW